MGDYYDLGDNIHFYDFFHDILIAMSLVPYGLYFASRTIRNLKQQYIDLLKMIQLLSVLVICLRFWIIILVQSTTNREQTGLFVIIFSDILNLRMTFIWLTQFSWYILMFHIKTYRMMSNGKSYSECKIQIKKIERTGILAILLVNIVVNLLTLSIDLINYYMHIAIMPGFNDVISFLYCCALAINEYFLYQNLSLTKPITPIFIVKNCINIIE